MAHSYSAIPKIKQLPLAPLERRHKVYLDFLMMLTLSEKHESDLLRRGLSHEIISGSLYRTVPINWGERFNIMYSLSEMHDLSGVPGFWYDEKNGQWKMCGNAGLLVPCCNKDNLIQGMQIRLDDVSDKKYRWFSSSKKECGCGADGCSVHIVGNPESETLGIIEGFLKADIASYHLDGACFAAVAGINSLKHLKSVVREIAPKRIIECGDMDKLTNPNVADGVAKIKAMLEPMCETYVSCKWDARYNGLDDYTLAKRQRKIYPIQTSNQNLKAA